MTHRLPTIEWQVCGICNYDCSYCIQSRASRTGHPGDAEVEGFLSFFRGLAPPVGRGLVPRLSESLDAPAPPPVGRGLVPRLSEPAPWEIKMTGGEPFAFRAFMERIVPGLVDETPHAVSVLTNLSAPVPLLERFGRLTRGRLRVVSASLHLEHVEPALFVEKAVALRAAMDPGARLVVNAVLVPGRLPAVRAAKAVVEAAGLRFFPQVMKVKHGVAAYPREEQPLLRELCGEEPTPDAANVAPSYRGRLCHAGAEYLVLTQTGDAWSCRTARRFDEGYLGNVLAGTFALRDGPAPCPYDICPCTTPANRGMVAGVGRAAALPAPA